ncbi:MAG: ATP synthase F1 subunit delta [Bacteroidales bacterium]|nr:ATP synthase F1 subunit delta [Bacteroidales bacterium]
MDQGLIPQRYARALYKVALERNCTKPLYDLMKRMADAFAAQPELGRVIENPYVDAERKQQLLMTAAGVESTDKTPAIETLADFIKLLQQNKRIEFAREAAIAYVSIYRKACNIATVKVTSASPLDAAASEKIKNIIAARNPQGVLEYEEIVDPELIGGFTINIDNQKLDASIKNELKQLRLKLLSH